MLVVAGVGLAVTLWVRGEGTPPRSPGEADARASADRLASSIRERASALQARTMTLSQLPRLAAAVTTDAATCADLTRDELAFVPLPDETIELWQHGAGGTQRLLHVPVTTAITAELVQPGLAIAIDRDALVIGDRLPIGPQGEIVVTWRARALLEGIVPGSLEVAGRTLAIGEPPGGGRTERITLDVPGDVSYVASLGPSATPASWTLRGAGLAFGFAAAMLAACWPRRRKHAPFVAPTGRRFGRYEALGLIGARGSGNAYVARTTGDAGFERRVTLDIVQPPDASDPRVVDALLDETRAASRVSHPNLIEILDLGYTGDECFIATEYVEGSDLERLLCHLRTTGRALPVAIVIAIARKLCDGLAAVHAALDQEGRPLGIVHRDVRPANVYLSRSGIVKLGGFGLATASPAPRLSVPELQGRAVDVDPRVDVWGVGAICYELLSLAPANPDVSLLLKRVDIPLDLDAVVRRALAAQRTDRHRTCAELETELAQIAIAYDLQLTDKQIAQWLATEMMSWSPTLRGWHANAAQPRS